MIWTCILDDLKEPVRYIPQGILIALAVAGAGVWLQRQRGERRSGGAAFWGRLFCAVLYGYVIIQIAFWSREPGTRSGVNLELLGTWGPGAQARAYVVENVMMFIPFGLLAPALVPGLKKGRWCVAAGFLCSLGIETAQHVTARGYFQLDDMVMNTLGTFLGWLGWKTLRHLGRGRMP